MAAPDLDSALRNRLDELAAARLRRELRELRPADGTRRVAPAATHPATLLNCSSNDYLGLAHHPAVQAGAIAALQAAGAGSGAARLVCGSLEIHHQLERDLADFKRCPAVLTFSSGYATALGTLPALVGPSDILLLDRLAHASLVDGARLSGARLRVFKHNDLADLERLLQWAATRTPIATPTTAPIPDRPEAPPTPGRILIVTESVFSMDGDVAPLAGIVALKERFGAWLMVDEAHAVGVLGPGGRGVLEDLGLTGRVEVAMGTLGKALGAAGGYIAGSAILRDFLINRARSFIFSTAPPPAVAGAARAAVAILGSEEGTRRIRQLHERLAELHAGLQRLGWVVPPPTSAIVPLVIGDEEAALRLSAALREEGVLVPAIRFPTVARGKARLRITLSAAHASADVAFLLEALQRAQTRTGIVPCSSRVEGRGSSDED